MKSIRETFLPDEGCVFVKCDLSQIEDRIGKMYCKTERMIKLANTLPNTYDAHTENAKAIFGKNDINKQERYLGKKAVHASWRGMRGEKLSESISKDTDGKLFINAKRCQDMIDTFLRVNYEIKDIYMPWVRERVRNDMILINSWGRRLDLHNRRFDDDLYRIAYSFYPQSECADWCNQYGFIPATYWMLEHYNKPLNAQVHDEVIASIPINETWEYAQFITNALEQWREIPSGSGNKLRIPAEITIARAWADEKCAEFKRLPDNSDEFYNTLSKKGFEV